MAMGNSRTSNLALVLLLVLSCSGLQMLCAPCAATAMACHADMQPSDYGGGELQAGCCCLLADGDVEPAPFVLIAEPETASTAQVGPMAVVELPTRPVAPLSRQAHASKSHPLLFQLHCSFLI
jgi:hypothetical protein